MTDIADTTQDIDDEERPVVNRFKFGYLVHDVSRTRRTLVDSYMRPLGLTRAQWSIMSALSRSHGKGLLQVDLARLLEVGKVTIGGLVDRLEASGHVMRRPEDNDRRAKRVVVTEKGFETINMMISVAERINRRILRNVTTEELEITERVLFRVKANIKEALQARSDHIEMIGDSYPSTADKARAVQDD